jgi:hypothetical protein
MLGLGRAAVARRAPLQSSDQLVVQIANMQISSHWVSLDIIGLNDLKYHQGGQQAFVGNQRRIAELPDLFGRKD